MRALSWNPILSNLVEARGELIHLHWRLHYIAFGRLPDEAEAKRICPLFVDWQNGGKEEFEAHLAREEEKRPFSEKALFNSLEHAYHHLNWAWNVRRTPEERVWHFKKEDPARWTKFPDTKEFTDLWPNERTVKEDVDTLGRRRIHSTPTRISVQTAAVKLDRLCDLVGQKQLSEAEFAKRLRHIYAELNMAWNARMDKTFVASAKAFLRRKLFPSIFATGSWNMWRANAVAVILTFASLVFAGCTSSAKDELGEYIDFCREVAQLPSNDDKVDWMVYPSTATTQEFKKDYRIVYADEKYLSFRCEEFKYTGGAHGTFIITVGTINRNSGRILKTKDAFAESDRGNLCATLRAKAIAELGGEENLLYEPTITENFCLMQDGWHFVYNEYELACYAKGAVEVVIDI